MADGNENAKTTAELSAEQVKQSEGIEAEAKAAAVEVTMLRKALSSIT